MTSTLNYFASQTVAERYSHGRPYFHPQIIARIRTVLGLDRPVSLALDVACGTGLSSLALAEIAESVVATDIAPHMLAQAPAHERIRYVEAPAENLPLAEHTCDLATVSLAFHWFDRTRFLSEARRVLRGNGTLVIYNNGFYGRMLENPEFARWDDERYLARYPTPSRHDQPFTDEAARESGFIFLQREPYTNEVVFSAEQLAQYLMTQSNVIAAVEHGGESLADVRAWLLETVRPYFSAEKATFVFGGEIWYLQPQVHPSSRS